MRENKKRSFGKSVTWRVCATLTTMILVWIFTGNLTIALSLGIVEIIIKMLVYYFHERVWNKIKWGIEYE